MMLLLHVAGILTVAVIQSAYVNATIKKKDETEALEKVAERMDKRFIRELGSQTNYDLDGQSHGLDMVLVIDRSSSVAPLQLEDAKYFVNFLLRKFDVGNELHKKGGTQAALLTFGTEVQMVFNINDYNITGPLAARQAVETIQPNGGGTNIEGALTTVILQVTRHLRKKSKKALFLITDGVPNIAVPGITAVDIAMYLRYNFNFEIFTVGIGIDIDRNFLTEIASKPSFSHVFILKEYSDLYEIMEIMKTGKLPAPPLTQDQCGYEDPRREMSPWQAILYISGGGALRKMRVCGGVLICSQWVLTAASCLLEGEERIPKKEIFVALGDRRLLQGDPNQTNFFVLDIKLHSKFDPSDPLNDNLALVKLNTLAHRYRPVCLPRTDMIMPLHQNLHVATSIAGWGLNAANPTYPSGASMQFKITNSSVLLAEEDECPGKRRDMPLICAGQGKMTCLGLMGSPVVAVDPATRLNHVLGVVAGRRHCMEGYNQYIELTKYIHWINLSTEHCTQKHWKL